MTPSMDSEPADTETHASTNGVSTSRAAQMSADRAAFLGMDTEAEKPKGKSAPAAAEVEDDDSDLDSDGDEVDADEDAEKSEDDDSDLDEDEGKSEDEDEDEDDKNVDADTAKRLAAVRKTDKRLREQREKQFEERENAVKAHERALSDKVAKLEAEWKPRIEAAEKFERAAARINVDPVGVLNALGFKPDRHEYLASTLYTLAKGKDDPKAQAAVAQLMRERERDDDIEDMKKWREEQKLADKQRQEEAAAAAHGQKLMASIVKTASDKTPLARTYLKSDPEGAQGDIARIASKLIDETGKMPEPKAVMIAFEKERRSLLRKMGIDPKKLSPSAANAAIVKSETTTTSKNKKTEKPTEKSDGKKNPRDEFISRKFD